MSCKWCSQYSSKNRTRTKLKKLVLSKCKCGDKNDK